MDEEELISAELEMGKIYTSKIRKLYNNQSKENNKSSNEFYMGEILYIGKTLRKDISNIHRIAINRNVIVRVYSFKDYRFHMGKLIIDLVRELETNPFERIFLNNQFLKAKKR